MKSFAEFGMRARTAEALLRQKIITPNFVQEQSIPPLLAGDDVVIEAPTGSGKTLAFLLPLIERFDGHRGDGVRGLIIAPTRELANQIQTVLKATEPVLRTALLIGGVPYGKQIAALRNGPDVLIGCPGRILDLASQRQIRFRNVSYLVLDEADELLNQGFAKDVERIMDLIPKDGRQTALASATMPEWVQTMISKHLVQPARVRVETANNSVLQHGLFAVRKEGKVDTLSRLLSAEPSQTIVFHRTKHGAKKLTRELTVRGHQAMELQGNLSQPARDRAIRSFRDGHTAVLVATNVAARGIDVANVGLVINYELPDSAEWLTHRVGRTARNGADGRALTFISDGDSEQWTKLRKQGAPNLAHVDTARFLESREWHTMPVRLDEKPNRSRPTVANRDSREQPARNHGFQRRRERPSGDPSQNERNGQRSQSGPGAGRGQTTTERPRRFGDRSSAARRRYRGPSSGTSAAT
jgi:ATP-dependent RNA helicase RhlE